MIMPGNFAKSSDCKEPSHGHLRFIHSIYIRPPRISVVSPIVVATRGFLCVRRHGTRHQIRKSKIYTALTLLSSARATAGPITVQQSCIGQNQRGWSMKNRQAKHYAIFYEDNCNIYNRATGRKE